MEDKNIVGEVNASDTKKEVKEQKLSAKKSTLTGERLAASEGRLSKVSLWQFLNLTDGISPIKKKAFEKYAHDQGWTKFTTAFAYEWEDRLNNMFK